MASRTQYSIVIAFIFFINAIGQNTDSLKLALKNAKNDTTRCSILCAMIEAEDNIAVWPQLNEQLLSLAEGRLTTATKTAPEYRLYLQYYATALNNVGYFNKIQGNMSKALEQYGKSLKISEQIGDQDAITSSLFNLGGLYESAGDVPKALSYYDRCLKIQEQIGDKTGIAESLNSIGFIYRNQGDVHKGLGYYRRSLKIREALGDKKRIAESLNNIGAVYCSQGDIPKALDYFSRSLKTQETIGDKDGIATSLNNIAAIHGDQGDLAKALEYYNRSLKIREEIGDKYKGATALCNIGIIYSKQGDISKALDYYARSLKLREELKDKEGIANSFDNIGSLYEHQHDLEKALDYYVRGLKLREEIGDKNGMAISYNSVGTLYFEQKRYARALEYTLKSKQIASELGYPPEIRDAAEQLNKIYRITGNYKSALENYELFIQMRDSVNNIETQKAAIKQQSKYEFDKQKALQDEKHAAELKIQEEKSQADKKRQNTIIGSVSVVLALVAFFSVLLYNRFKTTQRQKNIIEQKEKETQAQKHIIEEKQKEILDSINYAKRIQFTLLAHESFLKENLAEHFIYFKPKDIVSGDFFWAAKRDHYFYLAVCDSTGHGVPGAFMSLLNIGFLSEAINEKGIEKPNDVFNYVREKLTSTISKEGQKDGFDGVLLCFDQKRKSVTYASGNNAPILITNNQLVELPDDRMPVGIGEKKELFTLHTVETQAGDILYLYTDGYADQFGGPKGKKFKYRQLNELLLAQHNKPMPQQQQDLKIAFDSWKGDLEQVDDVCVLGIKV